MEMLILGMVIGFTVCWWLSKPYFAEQAEPIAMALGRERWRYLHTLRRELANRIMAQDPDGFVRLIRTLAEETASVHKLTAEDRDGQRAELAKKYPKVEDFDLINCRDYILYDDVFRDYKLETIKQRYRDIITYQALQLAADPLLKKAVWMSELIDADWTIHDYAERIKQRQHLAEEQEHEARRHRHIALWTELSPKVLRAIDLLNTKLAAHSLKLSFSAPEVFGSDDGYGVTCKLEGPIGTDFAYDGEQSLVVTDEGLYIGGVHDWSEGRLWPLDSLTVETIADAVAEVVQSFIDG